MHHCEPLSAPAGSRAALQALDLRVRPARLSALLCRAVLGVRCRAVQVVLAFEPPATGRGLILDLEQRTALLAPLFGRLRPNPTHPVQRYTALQPAAELLLQPCSTNPLGLLTALPRTRRTHSYASSFVALHCTVTALRMRTARSTHHSTHSLTAS